MSLAIDVDKVEAVLVGNKWYSVDDYKEKSSFDLDAYEYLQFWENDGIEKSNVLLGGGQESEAGVPATGFTFTNNGHQFCGPITAIQMIRMKLEK